MNRRVFCFHFVIVLFCFFFLVWILFIMIVISASSIKLQPFNSPDADT